MVVVHFFWSFIFALAAASSISRPRVLHERRSNAPQGFASLGAAPASQSLKLRFALASQDIPGLQKALLDVSTPSSPSYGNHLSKEEVNAFVAPTDEALAAVQNWLSSNNVTAVQSGAGDWLIATVPISKANELLAANYETFQHTSSGKSYARTLSYSLPAAVAAHIDDIHPSNTFNSPLSVRPVLSLPQSDSRNSNNAAQSCANTVTPACLQTLYGIPTTANNNSTTSNSTNSIAVAGFIDQFAQTADLTSFLQSFRKDILPATTFATQTLDGGQNTQNAADAGIEAIALIHDCMLTHKRLKLDIQYTVGIATGVPVVFVSAGENSQDGDLGGFLDMANFLSAESNTPQVLTTSYGENEADLSPALANKLCNAYTALGTRGTSQCTTFQAAFPAGCPFLTAVGAVHGTSPETASTFSSGGFSNVFGIPDYQKDAVAGYLTALGSTNSGLFNSSGGRGYPDVSAQGENFQIVSGGETQGVSGTSASSPLFASVIGLINDELVSTGKSPLGFLNPWLYANAAALNDVTTGSNPGCGTNGFPAKAGWDPVTGLGTPNFAALRTAAGL
ncbi:family S53 protease [Mycena rosella]|uniref:tripeptidyl-peptidase II n=1 Tax=Mycena rosella TaxID=1033263 RepID=A0AAD7DPP2_MYCRO|nr:family S53 protease [Mycena rosella]